MSSHLKETGKKERERWERLKDLNHVIEVLTSHHHLWSKDILWERRRKIALKLMEMDTQSFSWEARKVLHNRALLEFKEEVDLILTELLTERKKGEARRSFTKEEEQIWKKLENLRKILRYERMGDVVRKIKSSLRHAW